MPSKSPKQKRFMRAAAHNPGFAKKAGIPQKVAKEYATADAQEPDADDAPKRPKKGAGSPHGSDDVWGSC